MCICRSHALLNDSSPHANSMSNNSDSTCASSSGKVRRHAEIKVPCEAQERVKGSYYLSFTSVQLCLGAKVLFHAIAMCTRAVSESLHSFFPGSNLASPDTVNHSLTIRIEHLPDLADIGGLRIVVDCDEGDCRDTQQSLSKAVRVMAQLIFRSDLCGLQMPIQQHQVKKLNQLQPIYNVLLYCRFPIQPRPRSTSHQGYPQGQNFRSHI